MTPITSPLANSTAPAAPRPSRRFPPGRETFASLDASIGGSFRGPDMGLRLIHIPPLLQSNLRIRWRTPQNRGEPIPFGGRTGLQTRSKGAQMRSPTRLVVILAMAAVTLPLAALPALAKGAPGEDLAVTMVMAYGPISLVPIVFNGTATRI